MTLAQEKVLIQMADFCERVQKMHERNAEACVTGDKTSLQYFAYLAKEQADALRSSLALAEQARAMEGWNPIDGYRKGRVRVSMNNDGLWMVDDFPKFVGKDGEWTADLNQTAQFEELHEAIAAANAAMKAGGK
jgi:hypothetical protein